MLVLLGASMYAVCNVSQVIINFLVSFTFYFYMCLLLGATIYAVCNVTQGTNFLVRKSTDMNLPLQF